MKKLIIPVFIPFLGCPERCVYCDQESITGEKAKMPTAREVENTIKQYLSHSKAPKDIEVAVYGGTFTALSPSDQEFILKTITENTYIKPIKIRISTHPAYINDEAVERLKKYNVGAVELGIQSLDDNVLKALRRDYSKETVERSIKSLKQNGFTVGAQLMIGCPGEKEINYIDDLQLLIDRKVDFFRIYPLKTLKGTALHSMVEKKQLLLPDSSQTLGLLEKALVFLELKNKRVIRVGLPEGDGAEQSDFISEIHHPAIKEKIASRIALKILKEILNKKTKNGEIAITVNEKKLSEYRGHKNENMEALKATFPAKKITLKCDNSRDLDSIKVNDGEKDHFFSRKRLLRQIFKLKS